jgi:lipoprotein
MKGNINKALLVALPLALAACGGGGGDNPAADNTKPLSPNTTPNGVDKYGLNAQERQKAEEVSKELQPYGNGLENTYNGYSLTGTLDQIAANTEKATKLNRVSGKYKVQIDTSSRLDTVFIPTREAVEEYGRRMYGNQLPKQVGNVDVYGVHKTYTTGTDSYKTFQYFLASNDEKYKVVQFGIGKTLDDDPVLVTYYRGKTTAEKDMPTSGKFNYRGDFIVLPEMLPEGTSPVGAVSAVVDFGNKDAALSFAAANGYRGDINAKIIGSYLVGKDGNKAVDGIFSGSKAGAITGSYADGDAKILGVYGAIYQP